MPNVKKAGTAYLAQLRKIFLLVHSRHRLETDQKVLEGIGGDEVLELVRDDEHAREVHDL